MASSWASFSGARKSAVGAGIVVALVAMSQAILDMALFFTLSRFRWPVKLESFVLHAIYLYTEFVWSAELAVGLTKVREVGLGVRRNHPTFSRGCQWDFVCSSVMQA